LNRVIKKAIKAVLKVADANSLAQELSDGNGKSFLINEKMPSLCRKAAAEGAVLLKNDGVLPLEKDDKVAVFGRCAFDYFCVGYGSGGDVVAPYKTNLIEGLNANGVNLDERLIEAYSKWRNIPQNMPDDGFWGHWPFSYDEMPIGYELLCPSALNDTVAIIVIGRAAGEDRENKLKKGSYYLTDAEEELLKDVSEHFERVAVVLDIGNIIDMSWINRYKIGAVLLPWQGGMESGNAVADVLTGKVNPCGKLSDTIALKYEDYPSSANFGNKAFNNYVEDIYVGYRYFETFSPEKAMFPFGFGLSYTTFSMNCTNKKIDGFDYEISVDVKNTGSVSGKTVVQLYLEAPQGKLGKAAKVLICFAKTEMLEPDETQTVSLKFNLEEFASYDDEGVTENKSAYVLEEGRYRFFLGENVRDCVPVLSSEIDFTVVSQMSEVMAVKTENQFNRLVNRGGKAYMPTPAAQENLRLKILDNLPKAISQTADRGYILKDVKDGKISMDGFIAQLSNDELEALSRGEGGMHSKFGPQSNAGMFGGTTKSLREKGIPAVITTDGPAGIRLAATDSLLPCGTLLACTWDSKLVSALYHCCADEMLERGSDVLLAPGMNIHRNPLCGRNFEYFSEDPLLAGKIAAAVVNGLQHDGISACPKHFACNNQETNRNYNDSIVSERALREIYLKGFEICVKEAKPLNIMTSYNKINGVWSHYNYELITTVLRGEWKYSGNVMTDWWMRYAPSPEFPRIKGNGYRVRAGINLLMPGGKAFYDKSGKNDGTLLSTMGEHDGITLGEIQNNAKYILNMILKSSAMKK
jgi:beta-glucosidase